MFDPDRPIRHVSAVTQQSATGCFVAWGVTINRGFVVKTTAWRMSALLVLAGSFGGAYAQESQNGVSCPQLPANSGLTWEYKATGGSDFCRALRADGSEAFGLYISRKANFEPKRGNRAEEAVIDGQSVYWYKGELATKPDMQVRETLVQLPDGRVAHIWLQAAVPDLAPTLNQAQSMRFPATRLTSN